MNIITPFNYQPMERAQTITGERQYVTPSGKLPSVTTILSKTANNEGLEAWKKAVGEKKADQIRDEAASLGTLLHENLECHIQSIDRPKGNNTIRQMARNMANVIIDHGLINVDEVWGYEIPLYFPDQYAGTADLIGTYKGMPAIMDYKTTRKIKTKDMIVDYGCQLVAYADAHNAIYGTKIDCGVIFMVSRDLQFVTHIFEGKEFDMMRELWWHRVEKYYEWTPD